MRLMVGLVNNDTSTTPPVNLWRYLDDLGCNHRTLDYRSIDTSTSLDGMDCLFLGGTGEKTWLEPSPYAAERELIRRCRVPLLGICGGHQILAQAYGGALAPLPEPTYGRVRVEGSRACPLFMDMDDSFVVFTKHQYRLATVPEGFRQVARSAVTDAIYGIEHEIEPKFGVQFHPERRNDGTRILDNFMRLVRRHRRRREGRNENDSTMPPPRF